MQLTIYSVEYAPEELHGQLPLVVDLIREIPDDDRPDYWLGSVQHPVRYVKDNIETRITHVIVGARLVGGCLQLGADRLWVNIAFVTDQSLLGDVKLDFGKADYVAVGVASVTSGERSVRQSLATIARSFGQAFGSAKKK